MHLRVALGIWLGVVPAFGWAQTTDFDLERGELILAFSSSTTPSLERPTTVALSVWESGFVELTRKRFDAIVNRVEGGEAIQQVVSEDVIRDLRRALIDTGILELQGTLEIESGPPDGSAKRRVTFVERAPSWLHEFVDRHPEHYSLLKVYLRPRAASFAIPSVRARDERANEALDVIDDFIALAFPARPSLSFESILSTQFSPLSEPEDLVIEDEEAWCLFWDRLHSNQTPQPPCDRDLVDFSHQAVLASAIGWRSNLCYSASITAVEPGGGERLKVFVREIAPGPGCGCFLALATPVDVVVVDKPVSIADFFHETRINRCDL